VQHDWLDYVAAFSGLIGAALAAVAIAYAARQSAEAKRQLVRERRIEFELGLLAEIRRQMSMTDLQHLAGYVGALITDPEDETDLPTLRAAIGVKGGPRGEARQAQIEAQESYQPSVYGSMGVIKREAEAEVDAAISRRLRE
jgi:hypothetical protein